MNKVKVIVAGGRTFTDYNYLCAKLDFYLQNKDKSEVVIVSGTANGADKLGERYAKDRGYTLERYPADWDKHGKSAGYKRNTLMAENATHLVAFHDGKSKGTKHMIDIGKDKGLTVRVCPY